MQIRALVAPEDLYVALRKPILVLDSLIPNGEADRQVLGTGLDVATISIEFPRLVHTGVDVACSELGLARRRIGTGALLPPSKGHVALRPSVTFLVGGLAKPLPRDLARPSWVSEPEGFAGSLHGEDAGSGKQLVSVELCGGTVFGEVAKSQVLGTPRIGHGTSARCPNTGDNARSEIYRSASEDFRTCPREIPVFIRTMTFEDPVGLIKAHVPFQLDAHEKGSTVLVTIPNAPAIPLAHAHFSVRIVDLEGCEVPAKSEGSGS